MVVAIVLRQLCALPIIFFNTTNNLSIRIAKYKNLYKEGKLVANNNRLQITAVIWGSMAVALFGLFISGLGDAGLTIIHFMMALLLVAVPVAVTGFIWDWGRALSVDNSEQSSEKAKRDRIEHVLRGLSDTELQALKDRFSNKEIDDDVLYAHLSESEDIISGEN